MVDELTQDLTDEADRLCTLYKDLMGAPSFVLAVDFSVHRLFQEKSNVAAMKVFADVVDIRVDEIYEVAIQLGEMGAKEDYRSFQQLRFNNMIGEAYEEMDNPHASIPYYVKAAQLVDETGEQRRIGPQYCNLALAQKKCGLYSLAKKSYKRSMSAPFDELQGVEKNYQTLETEMKEWTGTSGKLTPHC